MQEPIDRFEDELKRLNDFYWSFRALCALAANHAPDKSLKSLVPTDVAAHLDISVADLLLRAQREEQQARNAVLTRAVTAYEDYLRGELEPFVRGTIDSKKQYTIKIRLADFASPIDEKAIRAAIAEGVVRGIIDASYSERPSRIRKVLKTHGRELATKGPDEALLEQACELRNCIVHASGIADARAAAALQGLFPGLAVGAEVRADEEQLWRLLGAIRSLARAIYRAIHTKKRQGGNRAANRQKRWNPGTRHPTKGINSRPR